MDVVMGNVIIENGLLATIERGVRKQKRDGGWLLGRGGAFGVKCHHWKQKGWREEVTTCPRSGLGKRCYLH